MAPKHFLETSDIVILSMIITHIRWVSALGMVVFGPLMLDLVHSGGILIKGSGLNILKGS